MLSDSGKLVKAELEELNQLKRKIRNLKMEIQELKELGAIPKRNDSSMPSGKGGFQSGPQERFIIRLEELEEKISNTIDKALAAEDLFLVNIEALDVLSQNLLMERYLTGKSIKRIIREFNYSERQIYRIYDKTFEKISQNHKDGSKCQ